MSGVSRVFRVAGLVVDGGGAFAGVLGGRCVCLPRFRTMVGYGYLDRGAGAGTPKCVPPDNVVSRWPQHGHGDRSEEHTSELQSLMRISYAVFCLKKKKT